MLFNSWDKNLIGDYSFAAGFGTVASGLLSTAMGNFTTASGFASTALGEYTVASGYSSTAFGISTKATGSYSASIGDSNTARAYSSLTIGRFNDSISASSPTGWVATDPVFIIGNGTTTNDRKNALTILKNAKMGINTVAPLAGLHIKGIETTFDAHLRLESAGANPDYANILYDGSLKFKTFGLSDEYQWRDVNNDILMRLEATGHLITFGGVNRNSDARLKMNIHTLKNSLQKILLLNGYHYNWIDKKRDKNLQTGLLAQEVEQLMPELVRTDTDGVKSVDYSGLILYMIEAFKKQQEKNRFTGKRIG